jgi:putative hydrolase of the HAD superfamily
MKAVVFDFFGTLTEPSLEPGRQAAYGVTARRLGIDPDAFWDTMGRLFTERATGVFGGTRDTLAAVAERCGASPSQAQLNAATWVHLANAVALRDDPDDFRPAHTIDELTGLIALIADDNAKITHARDEPVARRSLPDRTPAP